VLLVVFALSWRRELNLLRAEQAQMAHQLETQSALLMLMGVGNAMRIEMPAVDATTPDLSASLLYDAERYEGILSVDAFPPLPADSVYQMWLDHDKGQVNAGAFTVDEAGSGLHFFYSSRTMGRCNGAKITREPLPGSDQPTGPVIALAEF
jgi:hypothetical protein